MDRVIPVRFNDGTDDDLWELLRPHKGKVGSGGQSGEVKRLVRKGRDAEARERLMAERTTWTVK